MSVKIIATDLDGTLMSPDHLTVSERTKKALLEAHKKGIKIAIKYLEQQEKKGLVHFSDIGL